MKAGLVFVLVAATRVTAQEIDTVNFKSSRSHGSLADRAESDAESDRPVGVSGQCGKRECHFPTATFRRDRAACRILTPESLICAMPPSSAV